MKNSGGPLDSRTWQTGWKTAPLAKVQLCEYENQTLEGFVAVKFEFRVACQNFSLLSTVMIVKLLINKSTHYNEEYNRSDYI